MFLSSASNTDSVHTCILMEATCKPLAEFEEVTSIP